MCATSPIPSALPRSTCDPDNAGSAQGAGAISTPSTILVLALDAARALQDEARQALDPPSEMSEMESPRLQMAMDRISKSMSIPSNLLKKRSDIATAIVQNLKQENFPVTGATFPRPEANAPPVGRYRSTACIVKSRMGRSPCPGHD